jgi:hypothetical protein
MVIDGSQSIKAVDIGELGLNLNFSLFIRATQQYFQSLIDGFLLSKAEVQSSIVNRL